MVYLIQYDIYIYIQRVLIYWVNKSHKMRKMYNIKKLNFIFRQKFEIERRR